MISDHLLFLVVSIIGFVGGVYLAARQARESAHFGENTRRRMRVRANDTANATSPEYRAEVPAA